MSEEILSLPPIPADRRVRYGDDASQFFDVYDAKPAARGLAVMVHGGFWRAKYDLLHASHLCAALAAAGFACANLEYRRVGNGGGWPASLDDIRAGVERASSVLNTANVLGATPVVLGHSAGGHLALRVGSELPAIKGVVALAPCADLDLAYQLHLSNDAVVEFIGGTPKQRKQGYAAADASRHAARVPRILVHGTNDDVVPISLSRFFMARRKHDKPRPELIELAGADHFDLIDPRSRAWSTVVGAVERLSQKKS